MKNKIEHEELISHLYETLDDFQEYWKQIVVEYSNDYWVLARSNTYWYDTVGQQLNGSVVSDINDIYKINNVIMTVDTVIIYFHSAYGNHLCIPITWFDDRENHNREWECKAKKLYLKQLEDAIISHHDRIYKIKNEIKRINKL